MKKHPFTAMHTRWYYCDTEIIIGTLSDDSIVLHLRREGVPMEKIERVLKLTGFEIDEHIGEGYRLRRSENGESKGRSVGGGSLCTCEGATGS